MPRRALRTVRALVPALLITVLAGSTPAHVGAQGTRLLREPTISATQVAFTYGADLWIADRAGGLARRLTSTPAVEADPHFSPDGKWIYFNSERSGVMQIWRMTPDGGNQEQVTHDDYANWFAHPSPDGKWLSIISFDKNVKTHPPNQHVMLRLIELGDGHAPEDRRMHHDELKALLEGVRPL